MRHRTLFFATAFLALNLSACATTTPPPTSIEDVLDRTTADEKAMVAAEAAMQVADTLAGAAAQSGQIQPGSARAIALADQLEVAHGFLVSARRVRLLGGTYMPLVNRAVEAISAARALTPSS